MTFHSLAYLGFVAAVWLLVVAADRRSWRLGLLLAASYYFYYLWNPPFLLLLIAASLFNHLWGRWLQKHPTAPRLWVGLSANIGLLFFFKYSVWLLEMTGLDVSEISGLAVPVGISFFTFQAISYLLEIYRGYPDRPSWLEFLLYMAFWPTILSGPICRIPEMVPQFRNPATPRGQDVANGFRRIVFGLFMKVVVADTLAVGLLPGQGVVAGFDQRASWSGPDVLFLSLGFGLQIFFDFCGYSHVAIGSARLFGIVLRENFDQPYRALTVSEFWNRWHMSLSSWIRDYLFFPLSLISSGLAWRSMALVFSMTVFGVWHGAAGHFLLWGLYHGVLLAVHRLIQRWRRGRPQLLPSWLARSLSWLLTLALVTLGWVLFRAASVGQAFQMFAAVLSPAAEPQMDATFYWLVTVVGLGTVAWQGLSGVVRGLSRWPLGDRLVWLASPVCLAVLILLIIIWSDQSSPFVYVRF